MAEIYTISREGDGGISVERREVKVREHFGLILMEE